MDGNKQERKAVTKFNPADKSQRPDFKFPSKEQQVREETFKLFGFKEFPLTEIRRIDDAIKALGYSGSLIDNGNIVYRKDPEEAQFDVTKKDLGDGSQVLISAPRKQDNTLKKYEAVVAKNPKAVGHIDSIA